MALLDLKKAAHQWQKLVPSFPVLFLVDEEGLRIEDWANRFFGTSSNGENSPAEVFYADELEGEDFRNLVSTASLFSAERKIWVRGADRWSPKEMEIVVSVLESLDPSVRVFLDLRRWDGRTKWTQALVKSERLKVLKLEVMGPEELEHWLFSLAKKMGKALSPDAAHLMLDWTQGEAGELKQAFHLAALHAGERAEIQRLDVEAVGIRLAGANIFDFSSAVVLGQRREALNELEKLIGEGEEPIAVMGLLSRQFRWLLSIQAARGEGVGESDIASRCGIFPTAAKVLLPAARRRGGLDIMKSLELLSQWDRKLKSTHVLGRPDLMRALVLELTV